MALQRISNLALFSSTMRNITNTQSSLFDLQDQISSGIRAKNFKGLNGQVEQFIGLEAQIRKLDTFQKNNTVLEARLQSASQSVGSIIEVADQIEDLIVLKRSAVTSENLSFKLQLQNKIKAVADALNVSSEGRYLFGGTRTDTKPVPEALVSNISVGVPDTGYYVGSNESVVNRIDQSLEVEFPARGDDIAFQQVFAAVNLALEGDNNDASLAKAVQLIQEAQLGLNGVQARFNSTIINVQEINNRNEQQALYLKGVTEQVAKTDVVAATTKMANDQATLQASYQVFARLIQLKLSDYL